jgi:NAD(P) transhydrogenase subunit alpha
MALGSESEGDVMEAIAIISIFVLAVFVGFEVVSKVSSTLHTPLMSGANAIHGVILVGAIIVADHAETSLELGLSVAAIVLATINMVGGFVVTDRMLEMFKGKGSPKSSDKGAGDKK